MKYDDKHSTAIHEAGHAVVRIARGIAFESIELYDGEVDGASGLMRVETRPLFGEDILTAILSTLASIPAERLLYPRLAVWIFCTTVCKDDWNQACDMCDRHGYDVDELLKQATKMVRRLASSIHQVAMELEEHGRLSYQDVLEMCPDVAEEGQPFLVEQNSTAA